MSVQLRRSSRRRVQKPNIFLPEDFVNKKAGKAKKRKNPFRGKSMKEPQSKSAKQMGSSTSRKKQKTAYQLRKQNMLNNASNTREDIELSSSSSASDDENCRSEIAERIIKDKVLFQAVSGNKVALGVTVSEWFSRYCVEQRTALAELLKFLCRSCVGIENEAFEIALQKEMASLDVVNDDIENLVNTLCEVDVLKSYPLVDNSSNNHLPT